MLADWLLIAAVFAVLWLIWRMLNFVLEQIGRALDSRSGALDTAHGVGPWKRDGGFGDGAPAMHADSNRCTGRDARNAQKGPGA